MSEVLLVVDKSNPQLSHSLTVLCQEKGLSSVVCNTEKAAIARVIQSGAMAIIDTTRFREAKDLESTAKTKGIKFHKLNPSTPAYKFIDTL